MVFQRSFNSQNPLFIVVPVSVVPVNSSVIHVSSVPVNSIPVSSVSVIASLACIFVCPPPKIFPNSTGYIVLRMKNVVNPSAINITTKSNALTDAFL